MFAASVVIPTHNPRSAYLSRVLDSLQGQTLAKEQWELIVVDNACAEPLDGRVDVSWHPAARILREDDLGLTHARIRGIAESAGAIFVFVDDDNVLAPDYLEQSLKIGTDFPFLGAWGGSIDLEFDIPPEDWVLQYKRDLTYRQFTAPRWSNIKSDFESLPYGAGLCVRRDVCRRYVESIKGDALRRSLGRKGGSLLAGEDIDLALTAADFDLGWGNFPSLRLTHLIPPIRTDEGYLLRLREEVGLSNYIISALYGYAHPIAPWWRFALQWTWRWLRYGRRYCRFTTAGRRGEIRGQRAVATCRLE